MAKAKILTHPKFYEDKITTASINCLDTIQIEFQRQGINFSDQDLDAIFEFIYYKAEETLVK